MAVEFKLGVDEETMRALSELVEERGLTLSEGVRVLLTVWRYMDLAKDAAAPVYAEIDRLHILNEAALAQARAATALDLATAAGEKKLSRELYDAVELKPGAFGFKLDLKKIGGAIRRKRQKAKAPEQDTPPTR